MVLKSFKTDVCSKLQADSHSLNIRNVDEDWHDIGD